MKEKIIKVLLIGAIIGGYRVLYAPDEMSKGKEKGEIKWVEGARGWDENGTNLWTAVSPLPSYNVGIGTSTPSYKLDVVGSGRFQGDLYINSWPISVTSTPQVGYVLKWTGSAFTPQEDAGVGDCEWLDAGEYLYPADDAQQYTRIYESATPSSGYRLKAAYNSSIYGLIGTQYHGVYGSTDNPSGAGVMGINTLANADVPGVYGSSNVTDYYGYGGYFVGGYTGVRGVVSATGSQTYYGVYGSVSGGSGTNVGVYGDATGVTNRVAGVYGLSDKWGVYGKTSDETRFGVAGQNTNTSGTGTGGVGNNGDRFYYLYVGSGGAFTGYTCGVVGFATSTSGVRTGGYFTTTDQTAYVYVGLNDNGTIYKIMGQGTVSTIMETRAGKKNLFAPEMPEAWFEDVGEGQLKNGRAEIKLDPLFLDCVVIDDDNPLQVFVQLYDDCNGVYVKRHKDGFEVIELQNGKSNARFSYRVLAKWKGYEKLRFPDAPPPLTIASTKAPSIAPDAKALKKIEPPILSVQQIKVEPKKPVSPPEKEF